MLTVQTADCQCAACQALRRAHRRTGVKRSMPREPTEAMIGAGSMAMQEGKGAAATWRAMFDAELKD
jgi:hypothetical protein